MPQDTLLPDNRTSFEEAADLTGARIADLPIGLRQLVQPAAVPAPHLPWLAWGLSVDLWNKDWPEEKQRARTARSLPFHAIKGTQTAIAEALAVMGAEARRFIVPPAKTYLSKALTETERAAYLDRFAQLRIYPFIARGVSGRNTRFLSAPDGPGTAFSGPNNPVSITETKYIRTAKLHDRGAETDLTVRTVTPERVGAFDAISYDEVVLAPKPTAAQVPAEIEGAVTRRHGVDLESLSHGQRRRFYVDGDEPDTVLFGFTYSATGKLEEWKRYRRDPNCKQRLLIDRFDAADRVKSIGEVERAGGPDLWKGPSELPNKAKQAGLQVIYLAKEAKDQCYLRLVP